MQKTTFIFGAGTSMPYGFPSGKQLVKDIVSNQTKIPEAKDACLDVGLTPYARMIQGCGHDPKSSRVRNFYDHLKNSNTDSIDKFLNDRPEYQDIGKLAIAHEILQYEHSNRNNVCDITRDASSKMLYRYLIQAMSRGDLIDEMKNHRFITFNYDRLFQHAIFVTLVRGYGMTFQEAVDRMSELQVVHVYGGLGHYNITNFGSEHTELHPGQHVGMVKTSSTYLQLMYQQRGEEALVSRLSEVIEETSRVIILGFGYDPLNMALIRQARDYKKTQRDKQLASKQSMINWYGSAMGKMQGERFMIASTLSMDIANIGTEKQDDVMYLRHMGLLL